MIVALTIALPFENIVDLERREDPAIFQGVLLISVVEREGSPELIPLSRLLPRAFGPRDLARQDSPGGTAEVRR